jgi:thioredoxin 1
LSEILLEDTLTGIGNIVSRYPTVVVELGASWCGPCRNLLPHLNKLAINHPDWAVVKVDIDVDPAVVDDFGIQSVPHLYLYLDGKQVKELESRTVMGIEKEIEE